MHKIYHDSIASYLYNLSIHQLLGEYLAEFSTILDSFCTGIANIRSSPIGWKGGEWVVTSGGQTLCLHYNQPNGIHWYHFHLHISHRIVKSMAKLTIISQLCSKFYSQLSAYQGDMQPFEGNLSTCGHLTSLRNKLQQKQPRKLLASIPG